jgi:hypothetical protein
VLALVLVGGTAVGHAKLTTDRALEARELWVPDPQVARVGSLGFYNVVSDYYWIQALQVVGSSRTDPSAHAPLLAELIDVVTTLDPWVDHPYRFAALWFTDSLASVRKADALLDKGIAHHPDEWRNPFYQGMNRLLYLDEPARAADAIEKAAALPGSPAYLPRLVARLRAGGSGLEAAATMMRELVARASDPYEKAEFEKALDEIETERRARYLDAARAEFQRRRGRDIARVEDLLRPPDPVLRELPPELHGWEWGIDAKSGRIVSSWYGHRYEPFIHSAVRAERDAKKAQEQQLEGRAVP